MRNQHIMERVPLPLSQLSPPVSSATSTRALPSNEAAEEETGRNARHVKAMTATYAVFRCALVFPIPYLTRKGPRPPVTPTEDISTYPHLTLSVLLHNQCTLARAFTVTECGFMVLFSMPEGELCSPRCLNAVGFNVVFKQPPEAGRLCSREMLLCDTSVGMDIIEDFPLGLG